MATTAGEHVDPAPATEHPDEESIRTRAYEISQGHDPGSPEENWERAAAELRAGQQADDASQALGAR